MKHTAESLDDVGTLATAPGPEVDAVAARAASPDFLANGVRVGRYVLLRPLGVGAMGTVYLAYDPELDRRVALKLLRRGKTAEKRLALQREAQALAKLTHRNVVSVYDTGEHDGSVYVAMEFVEGTTLAKWLRQGPLASGRRPWREVVHAFVEAGRGLHAAHLRGLIHRDFKPNNVMITDEGHVQVMDFGLARPGTESSDGGADLGELSGSLLTEATVGRVQGTPAYMAPEQASAERLSPAADQFAFCVSLWEGLCGQRPFGGDSVGELFSNAAEGRIRSPPRKAGIPRWLRRTLRRGLAVDPARRWPSMVALIEALERGLQRWRWQLALGLAGVAAVPVGLWLVHDNLEARAQRSRVAACEAEGASIDEVWNAEARQRLRRGLLQTRVAFAQSSVDIIVPWLDDYHRTWRSGRTEACTRGSVEQQWSAELLDRSTWCFEDRRLQLEATIDQIARGTVTAARRAVRLASYLDPVEACLDPQLLARLPVPPPRVRDGVRQVRAELVRSDGLRHGGKPDQALAVAQEARTMAQALQWPPLVASAAFLEGRCLLEAGRLQDAEAALTEAYFVAQRAGSGEAAFRAARSLLRVKGNLGHYQQALDWARHADLVSQTMIDPGGLDEAEGHFLVSTVYLGLEQHASALREAQLGFEQRGQTLGLDHPITAAAEGALARVYLEMGRPEEALEHYEHAHEVWLDAIGPSHRRVAAMAVRRGAALRQTGRADEALLFVLQGLAVHEEVLAADHPDLALALEELGRVYTDLGRVEEAEFALGRAMAIRGPDAAER